MLDQKFSNFLCRGLACATAILFLQSTSFAETVVIRDIDVQSIGGVRLGDGVVLANMKTKAGDPLDEAVLDEDLKRLYDSGLFEDVSFLQEPFGDGARLIVMIEARAKLRPILFVGNSVISSKRLRNKIELVPNETWDDAALQQATEDIRAMYAKRGYPDVDVSYRIAAAEEGYSLMTFSIDEGQRTLLGEIQFEGNQTFTDRELRAKMKLKERKLLKLFGKHGKVDNRILEDDMLTIESAYRDAGYIDSRILDIERRPGSRDGYVDLILKIDEGQLYRVGSVGVTGATAVSAERLQLQPGRVYSAKAVREDIEFIREFYGRKGFLNLHVRPILTSAGDAILDVEYSVYEGATFTVGEIDIVGNEVTRDRVIRRELAILPGEPFNTSLLDASARRLRGLPNFSRVEVSPVSSSENGYKDVRITVTEKPTGEIAFGAGIGSNDGVVGFLKVNQNNFDLTGWPKFTGAGQKFRLNLQAGARRRDFELGFSEPWLGGIELALNTGVYYRDVFYNSDLYDERHYGAEASLRTKLGEHSSITGGYKLDFGKIHNVDSDASEEIVAEEGSFTDSMLFAEYNITTLDNFKFPRRGHRMHLRGEVSGLGGDVNTYAFELGGAKYYHLPLDSVFHVEGLFRTTDSYGSGGVPISKREFLGGTTNLRGFDYREVSPKDSSGEPIGGLSSLYVTTELSTPLPGKLGDRVRLAGFFDAGTVSSSAWDVDDIYGDVGIGLRIFLRENAPPLRLDYAFPLKTDEFGDSGGKFSLQMGFKF